ncbi:small lipoprotein [Enterobacterales bacterium]|nr:small lipoprotein [Enterobacterales bacterium]
MKNVLRISVLGLALSILSGCTGSVYNKQKNCTYDYLLVPAISISKMIGSCGPVDK